MADTIFSKIIDGELPANKVYEDDDVLAFLDINPSAEGHTLVIHKHDRSANLSDVAPEASAQLMHATQEVIKLLKNNLGADAVNVLLAEGSVAGQEVMHAHIHLVPRRKGDGLHLHAVAGSSLEVSQEDLEETAERIRS